MNPRIVAWLRIAFALLVLAALGTQIALLVGTVGFNPTRFFLFFTVLSNLFSAGVFVDGARRELTGRPPVPDLVRGAAVVVMTVTFLVFAVLLSNLQEQLQTNIPWVDAVLHRVMPVVVMLDWVIAPPSDPVPFRRALPVWLGPPAVWTVVTLIRGAVDGWYPYPFLNPANGGYGTVAAYVVGILVLFVVVTWAVAALGSALRARRATDVKAS